MQFCPKCGSLLKSKQVSGKSVYFCSCGYTKKSISEEIVKESVRVDDTIPEANDVNPLANENHVCKKCGYNKAILVAPQAAVRETWGHSETNRPAYICGKCGAKEFI